MPSSCFREDLARVLEEARAQRHDHDVDIILQVVALLDAGRYEELPALLLSLRPIFRSRLGTPPSSRTEDQRTAP